MRRFVQLLSAPCLCILLAGCAADAQSAPSVSSAATSSLAAADPLNAALVNGDIPVASTGANVQRTDVGERSDGAGSFEIGAPSAPELLLFTNYSCHYCQVFEHTQLPGLQQDLIAKGLLRVRRIPVAFRKYPSSTLEASAIVCASAEGKGMAMSDALFSLQTHTLATVLKAATTAGMNAKAFQTCINAPATKTAVDQFAAFAQAQHVTHVPTFIVGNERLEGLAEEPDFRAWLQESLAKAR